MTVSPRQKRPRATTKNARKSVAEERTRLLRAQASRAELELAVRAGQLVDAAEVAKAAHETALAFATAMHVLPAKLAPIVISLDQHAAHQVLEEAIDDALVGLAEGLGGKKARR